MSEPTKKHSVISSNQMLRNIHKSLKHLQLREQQQQHQNQQQRLQKHEANINQSQSQFEDQLSQDYNINSLAQSSAGERNSYPCATTPKTFTIEEIRKDIQPFAWRNGVASTNKSGIKSSSITDLHQTLKEYDNSLNSSDTISQQKLAAQLISRGYDKGVAADVLRNPNNTKSIEMLSDNLNKTRHRVLTTSPQAANMAGFASRYYPTYDTRSQYNDSGNNYVNGGAQAAFETQSLPRQYSRESELRQQMYSSKNNLYSESSVELINSKTAQDLHHQQYGRTNEPTRSKYDNPIMRPVEVPHPKFNAQVALRQKNGKKFNPQNRWSADVLQILPDKPPPPYPGPLHVDSSQNVFEKKSESNASSNHSSPLTSSEFPVYNDKAAYSSNSSLYTSSHSPDTMFRPVSRRSPPPYPGSNHRSSLNIEEMENNNALYNFNDFKKPNDVLLTDSSTEVAEVMEVVKKESQPSNERTDGVKRSYSPLPTCTNSPYHTMIIRKEDEREDNMEVDESVEHSSLRLKNYTPQACKFYLEQHFENILKRQGERAFRREQLETEMARVRLPVQAQEEMRKLLIQKESNYIRLRRAKMDKSMFSRVKVIGVGAFGEVSLVKKNGTEAFYAMKTLRKSEVLRRNQVAHVKAERDILAEADNEWVVKLYYSFQDVNNLYFVMDYVPGGDLMALLIKKGVFEDELARFYIGELVLAIESVHKLGFIHRDIKPDNVLIDKNGHIKLTDFGLCTGFRWTHDSKYYQPEEDRMGHSRQYSMEPEGGWDSLKDPNCDCCKGKRLDYDLCKPLERRKMRRHMRCQAHSLVGTPNYIAPEVLKRIPYSQQCDWWSVGVILFEMLIGQPPFFAHTAAETQMKIIHWRETLAIRHKIPRHSEDLILRLCTSPEKRIGRNGAEEIKNHPYFAGINFATIHEAKAPFIPQIKSPTDTSNFDPVPEEMTNGLDEAPSDTINDNDDKGPAAYAFYEFTFRHFFDDGGFANPVKKEDEHPKPRNLSHAKRPANVNNNSISVPSKVPAPNSLEDKEPVFV